MPSVPAENLVPPASLSVGSIRVLLNAISLFSMITSLGAAQSTQACVTLSPYRPLWWV